MLSYKDKTFCASDCCNRACHRHKSHCKVQPRGFELPVAQADFSSECSEYRPPRERDEITIDTLGDSIIE